MRTAKTRQKKKEYDLKYPNRDPFLDLNTRRIQEFSYWLIIKNDFPYDRVAERSHLLIPKRKFADFKDMRPREYKEFLKIHEKIASQYDCILENFPRNKSVHAHFHFHLLELKDEYK